MFHMKDRPPFKLHHWTLSEMVYHFLFLLLLPHYCEGVPLVIGPSQPVVVNVGDDVILPCHIEPSVDAAPHTVEWTRPDLNPRFVHVWRSGEELLENQNPSYVGRTSLFVSELKNGNVSLKLSRAKPSDRGTYRCFIPTINRDTTVELLFGSVSSPGINVSKSSDRVWLDCRSEGWFPQPELLWLDSKGRVLSAGPTETLRGPDGLFTVSSRLSVEKSNRDRFTCRVHQKEITQTRETHVQISADFFETCSSCSSVAYISIIVVLVLSLVVVVAVFIIWKLRKIQTKVTNCQQTEAERREGEQLMVNIQNLEEKKKRLEEEFQKKEKEVQLFELMIHKLEEHREDIKNQMDKLKNQREDVERNVEEIEEKLKSAEQMAEGDQVQEFLGMKTSISTAKIHLLNGKPSFYNATLELQSKTGGLLEMIRNRKRAAESDMEQIRDRLEKIQREFS